MKSIRAYFVLFSILCGTSSLQAQITDLQKKWVLNANIGYNDAVSKVNQTPLHNQIYVRNFIFSPTLGYFISNHLQVGVRTTFRNTHHEEWDVNREQNTLSQSFGLGVYSRNYSWLSKHFGFYLESGLMYSYDIANSKTHYYRGQPNLITSKGRGSSVQLYLRPGFTWQINQRIAIDFTTQLFDASYRYYKQKPGGDHQFSKSEEGFSANISNSNRLLQNIQLGISIFI